MNGGGLKVTFAGLQARLVLATAAVVLLAVFVTGAVFVYRDRQEQQSATLERIATATNSFAVSLAPVNASNSIAGINAQFDVKAFSPATEPAVVVGAATATVVKDPDYRILLVNSTGQVVTDPGGYLTGVQLAYPQLNAADTGRGYVTWDYTPDGFSSLTMLSPANALPFHAPLPIEGAPAAAGGLYAVAAINPNSLTADWLAVVPQLGLAALAGLPVALLAAVLLTRQITQPLRRLTFAVEAISRGDFDQRVDVRGRDEVATLAQSFSVMAGRVKDRDTQLRGLLANVSHDLRTPLTSIQGYAEAMVDGVAASGDVDRVAGIIREEARHATSLLADLLSLSEIDAGDAVPLREPVEVAALVERCLRRISARAAAGSIEIRSNLEGTLAVAGDPDKLERALTNLLDNAVKFAAKQIEVRAWQDTSYSVSLSVANDGPAITPEEAPRVFERFYRGARRGAGTGLGLAIARELVELNGGRLTLHSASPVEFRLALPAHASLPAGLPPH